MTNIKQNNEGKSTNRTKHHQNTNPSQQATSQPTLIVNQHKKVMLETNIKFKIKYNISPNRNKKHLQTEHIQNNTL